LELLVALAGLLSIIIIGLERLQVFGKMRDFPDGLLEYILNVFGIESVFFVMAHESNELLSHI
jgi:hypothetical protein